MGWTPSPANHPTIIAPAPDPTITTSILFNPPTPVVPEPDTTITTCVYANPHNQNYPVPYPTPRPTHVAPISDTPSPTTIIPMVVDDCHGVKWYDSKDVIDLNEVPSLQ